VVLVQTTFEDVFPVEATRVEEYLQQVIFFSWPFVCERDIHSSIAYSAKVGMCKVKLLCADEMQRKGCKVALLIDCF
jgi:hypothetical protein